MLDEELSFPALYHCYWNQFAFILEVCGSYPEYSYFNKRYNR
jgi:hypothetical protein